MPIPGDNWRPRAAVLSVMLFCWAGCSASSADTTTADPTCDSSAITVIAPPPSAKATADDVKPILAKSCALGGCHVGAVGAGDLVFPLSSDEWRTNIVGRHSQENPAMLLVAAGDPDRSWLMQKLTGAFCAAEASCDSHLGCGQRMPFGQALSAGDMTTFYIWIRAGALP